MSCKDCEARRKLAREALLNAHIGQAVKHVAVGAAELTGLKEKTGTKELASKPKTKPRKTKPRTTKPNSGPAGSKPILGQEI